MDAQVGIISDVHGNREALTTAIEYLADQGVSEIYHLGDVVGYGEAGQECLQLLQQLNIPSIQGNHDGNIRPPRDPRMREEAQVALERDLGILDEREVEWLVRLPTERIIEDELLLVHGAITHRDDYILSGEAVRVNNELLNTKYAGIHIAFFGHSHLPMVIQGSKVDMTWRETRTVPLEADKPYLINAGSVGQPRDKCPKTSFGIYNREEQTMTIVRLEYDIEAEQKRMRKAGLPDKLIKRIAYGV